MYKVIYKTNLDIYPEYQLRKSHFSVWQHQEHYRSANRVNKLFLFGARLFSNYVDVKDSLPHSLRDIKLIYNWHPKIHWKKNAKIR